MTVMKSDGSENPFALRQVHTVSPFLLKWVKSSGSSEAVDSVTKAIYKKINMSTLLITYTHLFDIS